MDELELLRAEYARTRGEIATLERRCTGNRHRLVLLARGNKHLRVQIEALREQAITLQARITALEQQVQQHRHDGQSGTDN